MITFIFWQTVEILSMWKQAVDNVCVPDSSSSTFEYTATIKRAFSLFKVLATVDTFGCNEINLLKARKNTLILICAFKFTTNLRWLSSISFKGYIRHGSWGWAFYWDNLPINVVQTHDENHHLISTQVGLFQCKRQDNIYTCDMVTR